MNIKITHKVDLAKMESNRLISNKEISSIIRSVKDFYKRSHNLNPIKITYWLFIILMAALFLIQCLSGVMSADITKYHLDNLIVSTMVINIFFIILVIAATYLIYKMQRIVLVAEFQNLLFSSAMRNNSLFYIVFSVKNIVYMDQNAREFFKTDSKSSTINDLLKMLDISNEKISEIQEKIDQCKASTINYKNKENNIKFDFIPLKRPNGFFALKGVQC